MVYVLPDMIGVIENTGQTLPWATKLLISVTELLKSFWWVLLCGILALSLFIRGILNREKVRLIWDAYKFSLPIIGKIIRISSSARFSNTLSILTRSGIPLVDAMKIASEVVANKALQTDLRTATQDVVEGKSLRESLENISHFAPMMMHMIGSGEKSGELDQMLGRVAVQMEQSVEMLMNVLLSLFGPLMLVVMGGAVFTIVMAILLPIINLNQLVGL